MRWHWLTSVVLAATAVLTAHGAAPDDEPSLLQGAFASPPTFSASLERQTPPAATDGIRPPQAALRPSDASIGSDGWSSDEMLNDCFGCGCVWSHWTIDLDAVFLRRSTPKSLALALMNPGVEPSTRSMTFDHEAGPRLALIRRGISGWDVELNYLGIEGFHSTLNMPDALEQRLPGDDPGGVFLSGLFQGSLYDYVSRLHSEELNLRRPWGENFTALVGVRAVQVHERFQAQGGDQALDLYSITADNRLYGMQVGGDGTVLRWGPFTLSTMIKAGLFDNNSEQFTTDLSGFFTQSSSNAELSASTNQLSVLGEVGLTGVYQVSETIFVRAGYHWMWITDLALASDQIPLNEFETNPAPPPNLALRGISAASSLHFHGASVGVELSW